MKTKNKKNALQLLKEERIRLKTSYTSREKSIGDDLAELKDNWPGLLMQASISKVKDSMGISSNPNYLLPSDDSTTSNAVEKLKSIGRVTVTALPIVWTVAQPFLIKYAIKKFTNLIFRRKDA